MNFFAYLCVYCVFWAINCDLKHGVIAGSVNGQQLIMKVLHLYENVPNVFQFVQVNLLKIGKMFLVCLVHSNMHLYARANNDKISENLETTILNITTSCHDLCSMRCIYTVTDIVLQTLATIFLNN